MQKPNATGEFENLENELSLDDVDDMISLETPEESQQNISEPENLWETFLQTDSKNLSWEPVENVVQDSSLTRTESLDSDAMDEQGYKKLDVSPIGEAVDTSEFNLDAVWVSIKGKEEDWSLDPEDSLVDFSYKKHETPKAKFHNYKNWWGIVNVFMLIGISAILILWGYYIYLLYAPQSDLIWPKLKYVDTLRNLRTTIGNYIDVDKTKNYKNSTILSGFHTILNASDIGYIDKWYLLRDKMNPFMDQLSEQKSLLEDNKKNVTKYAYLPKEIWIIIWEDDAINSIEDSLLALETIKFTSAVNVFMHLDSFTKNLSKSLSISRNIIKENMEYIREKGEKDIRLYIEKCYLNPFETNYDCNIIWDYDRNKRIIDPDSNIDTTFLKKMMYYIDLKLERTELPSFNIVFQRFDKNNDKVTFTIDINTLKQDELELIKSWILDEPVIFIMDKLINNLKRSRYIKGNEIKIPSLRVQSKKIKIGITEFLVNTISRSFELPIQKDSEREIYDFVEQWV